MLARSIQNLIEEFSSLPGIGPKSASRIVFYLLKSHQNDLDKMANAVSALKKDLKICSKCFNYGESDPCDICTDSKRDQSAVCVVEEPLDVIALDRAGFSGVFHVLGGVISPINGIGPDDVRIRELVDRVRSGSGVIKEVILATNPSLEGEATAVYVQDRLSGIDVQVTRLARGLPVGGDLEYADELTLSRSLEGRKEF
jgi:recombination protein RecR